MNPPLVVALFLSVATISLFSFISVAAWSDARRREREAYYRSDTLKKLAESQTAAAAPIVELLREQDRREVRRRREGIKLGGLVSTAVGIGVLPLLRAVEQNERVFLAAFVPILVGLALLSYVYILAPKE